MKDEEANFPLEIEDRLVQILQKIILLGVKVLAILMTGMILWGVLDVTLLIYNKMMDPNQHFLNIEELLSTLGAFLVVLIAIEVFLNIILYLKKDTLHLKLVLATALMAIARKVIILNYETIPPAHLYGISTLVLALGIAYWLTHRIKKWQ